MSAASTAATVTAVAAVALAAGTYAGFKLAEITERPSMALADLLLSLKLEDVIADAEAADQ